MGDQFDTGAFVRGLCEKVRDGYGFNQALDAMKDELPEPTAGEVRQTVEEIRAGRDMWVALEQLAVRNGEDMKLIVGAILIGRDHGGSIADEIEFVEQVIRRSKEVG